VVRVFFLDAYYVFHFVRSKVPFSQGLPFPPAKVPAPPFVQNNRARLAFSTSSPLGSPQDTGRFFFREFFGGTAPSFRFSWLPPKKPAPLGEARAVLLPQPFPPFFSVR